MGKAMGHGHPGIPIEMDLPGGMEYISMFFTYDPWDMGIFNNTTN